MFIAYVATRIHTSNESIFQTPWVIIACNRTTSCTINSQAVGRPVTRGALELTATTYLREDVPDVDGHNIPAGGRTRRIRTAL